MDNWTGNTEEKAPGEGKTDGTVEAVLPIRGVKILDSEEIVEKFHLCQRISNQLFWRRQLKALGTFLTVAWWMQQPSAATGWLWGLDLPPSVRQGWQPIWTGNGWGDIWQAKSRPQHKDSGGRGRAGVGTPKAVRFGRTWRSCGGNWSKRMWGMQWGEK